MFLLITMLGLISEGGLAELPPVGTHLSWPEMIDQGDGNVGPIERGILFVPANRSNAESGSIAVSYWRLKRLGGPKPDQPPIFILDGGPGFVGYNRYSASWYVDYTRQLQEIADVVWVGQRGIGAAFPSTDCAPPKGTRNTPLDSNFAEAVSEASRKCFELWRSLGIDIEGLTVPAAAADVDDLRDTLGYTKVILWGESFGTHWSIEVMRQFPNAVARAVLNSIEGPDHTYDDPAGQFAALRRIAQDAEQSGVYKNVMPKGGFIAALQRLISEAELNPIFVEREGSKFEITADMLRRLATGYLNAPSGTRREASWPLGIIKWVNGDFEQTIERLEGANGFGDFWHSASYFQFDCGSGISRQRDARLLGDPARKWVGERNALYRNACKHWPADSGEAFRSRFASDVPTLVVHGDWDLSTPWENALELEDQFENGTLIRVRRGRHGALWKAMEHDAAFRSSVRRFLQGETDSVSQLEVTLPVPKWQLPESQ
ncbi:MAG: alpha/beta fold hydrolase [Pseudomonadota bacterium]